MIYFYLAQHRWKQLQHFPSSPLSRRCINFSAHIISLKRKRQTYDSYSKECYHSRISPFHRLVNLFWEANCNCIYINANLSISRTGFLVALVTSTSQAEERKWLPSSHGKRAASTFLQWEFNSLEKFSGSICVDCLWHWLSKAVPSNPYFIGENKIPVAQHQMVQLRGTAFPSEFAVPLSLQSLSVCRTLPGLTFPGRIKIFEYRCLTWA